MKNPAKSLNPVFMGEGRRKENEDTFRVQQENPQVFFAVKQSKQ